jgi:ADP-ribose pyrophosphatase YjhB (NUDIX family)
LNYPWLDIAKRLQAIAQTGLTYTEGEFDKERYQMIRDISVEIVSSFSDTDNEKVERLFASDVGYPTPKVEVRAVVFKDNKILMVRERVDGKWALPGGWADVGHTPFEVAKKEVFEEAGIVVSPKKLLAVFDKSKHGAPVSPDHIYQLFILCDYVAGEPTGGMETLEASYYYRNELPELSTDRTIEEDMKMVFEFFDNPEKLVLCD